MSAPSPIVLGRACPAVRIPSGLPILLDKGEEVVIVQQLGASVTVAHSALGLVRIAREDGDALGLVSLPATSTAHAAESVPGALTVERVLEALRDVYDPEIPINVVDLGLIYCCELRPDAAGCHDVRIEMSMTAPGCGMGDVLRDEVATRVRALHGASDVEVRLVFDPPWDLSRLSEVARLELGL